MLVLGLFFVAHDWLIYTIKLFARVLISSLIHVNLILMCISYWRFLIVSNYPLVDELTGEAVPEAYHIESIDSCEDIVLLLP